MSDALDETRFWSQVIGDSQRTILCNPEHESRIKGWVAAHSLGGMIEVVAMPHVPLDAAYIIDYNAIEAAMREMRQKTDRSST